MDALTRLVAIEDIRQLKSRYFRLMDTRDWAGLAEVFCRDAEFDCSEAFQHTPVDGEPVGEVGPITRGREVITAWISGSFRHQTSIHHGHGHEITVDSETEAHGVIAMEDRIRSADRRTEVLHAAGHYHERYRFEDGAWRIAYFKLTRLYNDIDQGAFYKAEAQ